MSAPWTDVLRRMGACENAVAWAETQPDLPTAWEVCDRPDWLLWLAGRVLTDADCPAIVRSAAGIARTALIHIPAGEDRPRLAIEAAEAWAECPCEAHRAAKAAARAAAWAAAEAAAGAAHADIIRRYIPATRIVAAVAAWQEAHP